MADTAIKNLPIETSPAVTDYLVGDFGTPPRTKRVAIGDLPGGSGGAGSDTATTSSALSANDLTYVKADGTLAKADATAEGKEAVSFVAAGFSSGATATHYFAGNLMTGLSGLTPGADYFMSTTPGLLTATPPSTTGNVVMKVGTAVSATELAFAPSIPVTYAAGVDPLYATLAALAASGGSSLVGHIGAGVGAAATTVGAELNALNQKRTGNFYSHASAKISRLNDRVFIGAATLNDGAFPNVIEDWLTTFQKAAGLGNGSIVSAQAAVLNDANTQANVGFIAGSQSATFTSADPSCIAVSGYVVNNNTTYNTYAWGLYSEAHRTVGGGCIYGIEVDTRTMTASIKPDPYAQGDVVGMQIASGAGLSASGQYDGSAAIQIEDNPMKWKVGINFGSASLTSDNRAISFAQNHFMEWQRAANTVTAKIGASSTTSSVWVDFGDDKIVFKTLAGVTLFELSTAGRVGIGGSPSASRTLELTKALTGGTLVIGARSAGQIQSDATSEARLFATSASTQAASFNVPLLSHYNAAQGVFGAGSSVSEQAGFHVDATLTGGTLNYAFSGLIAAGTGRFNNYMSGTANNAYAGNSKFGAVTAPTAKVDIAAGTATASTAPLKFTSGTNLTTPEAGAVEFDGTNYFVTTGTTRFTLAKTLTATATLDFGNTAAGTSTDLTITVTGAAVGDCVVLGVPHGSMNANTTFFGWVSATDTVTVRFENGNLVTAVDPASGTFRASVLAYG